MELNLERYGRLIIDGTEYDSIDIGAGHFDKAVDTTTEKSASVTVKPTRVAGGDDVTYPAFTPTDVLSSLKAFGAAPVKHKQDALFGRYVPFYSVDQTVYPYRLEGFKKVILNGSETWTAMTNDRGYYTKFNDMIVAGYRNVIALSTDFVFDFWDSNSESMPVNHFGCNHEVATGNVNRNVTFRPDLTTYSDVDKWKTRLATSPITVLYQLTTSDNSVWISCVDTVATPNKFGYLNKTTGEFIVAAGMGRYRRVEYIESHGTEYINLGYQLDTTKSIKDVIDAKWNGDSNDGLFSFQQDYEGWYIGTYGGKFAFNSNTTLTASASVRTTLTHTIEVGGKIAH